PRLCEGPPRLPRVVRRAVTRSGVYFAADEAPHLLLVWFPRRRCPRRRRVCGRHQGQPPAGRRRRRAATRRSGPASRRRAARRAPAGAARRPPPPVTGTVNVAGLTGPVDVLRDTYGAVHIYAANAADAFRVQGYQVARDRTVQLELLRRSATGRLAEVFGNL